MMQRLMEEQVPPRVTALVVSRNSETALRLCLDALEHSTRRDQLEILVIDDGSHDGSASIPHDYTDVISLKLPKRFGWTRAVNIGLRTAKGDLVFLLPPWCAVEPDTISRLADRLQMSNDVGAVCPQTAEVHPFPSPTELRNAWHTGELPGAARVIAGEQLVDYPQGAAVMVRRELLRNMNYLDERFGDRWADLEMYSRIRNSGKAVLVLNEVPVHCEGAPETDLTQLEWTDSANGVATWISLHHGGFAGVQARIGMAVHALGRGKTSAATGILTATKIDGNQE